VSEYFTLTALLFINAVNHPEKILYKIMSIELSTIEFDFGKNEMWYG